MRPPDTYAITCPSHLIGEPCIRLFPLGRSLRTAPSIYRDIVLRGTGVIKTALERFQSDLFLFPFCRT